MEPLKTPLSYEEQVAHLKAAHALMIRDEPGAVRILQNVNYYRLSAYGIGLRREDNRELYREGISLEHIYRLYRFDSQLRNSLIPVIEYLEIELRAKIAYHLAMAYGAEGFRDPSHFISKTNRQGESIHANIVAKFEKEIEKQKTLPCVIHHRNKYGGHFPVWAAVELFTFGMLSSLYSVMLPQDKRAIAQAYHTDDFHLRSWLLCLVEIRNVCAHYGRLYNMPLKQTPQLYTEHKPYQSNRLFAVLLVIRRIMENTAEWRTFRAALTGLTEEYDEVVLSYIGFPANWEKIL